METPFTYDELRMMRDALNEWDEMITLETFNPLMDKLDRMIRSNIKGQYLELRAYGYQYPIIEVYR